MTRRLIVAAVIVLAVLTSAAECEDSTAPVQDGKGKSKAIGGRIQNDPDSIQRINVYKDWGSSGPAGDPTSLKPGEKTPAKTDIDGYCLLDYPAEVTKILPLFQVKVTSVVQAGKCVKISDTDSVVVRVVKRLAAR